MKRQEEIDLHGVEHEKVKQLLIAKIEKLWGSDTSLIIITGNSSKMKSVVIQILKEYKLEYSEPDIWESNRGIIKTLIW